MRLTIVYSIARVPLDYRAAFARLIRYAVRVAEPGLFKELYETPGPVIKPFCFSVLFQDPTLKDDEIETGGYTNLDLSVLDFAEGKERADTRTSLALFNGLRSLKTGAFPFPLGEQLRRVQSQILPEKTAAYFASGRARFKTLSPILLSENEEKNGWHSIEAQSTYDRLGSDSPLDRAAIDRDSLTKVLSSSLEGYLKGPVAFKTIDLSVEAVRHSLGDDITSLDKQLVLPGSSGSFVLEAAPDDLYRIYQLGIGFKRDRGFGMLEAV